MDTKSNFRHLRAGRILIKPITIDRLRMLNDKDFQTARGQSRSESDTLSGNKAAAEILDAVFVTPNIS